MKAPPFPSSLKDSLQMLYSFSFGAERTYVHPAEHSFINNDLIERSIATLAHELQGELIDVGCASQPYNLYFKHVEKKVNCDFDGGRGNVDFECSADCIPVEAESFDSVLCTEVLEHTPKPDRVWQEFWRILRPGGKVLLSTPMYWPAHELPYDFYRYPEHGLRYLAEQNGFEVLALCPRGGVYAFIGQTIIMGIDHYFAFKWQRTLWNRFFLKMDKARLNPKMTLGWTILARKVEKRAL